MKNDSLRATVQYDDYTGTVAADRRDNVYLHQLAEKYGIDTRRYFVFGITAYIDELGRDELDRIIVNVLAVDTQVTGAVDVDSLQQYIDDNEGVLPYVKLKIETYLGEIIEFCFKRFDLVLQHRKITANEYRLTN